MGPVWDTQAIMLMANEKPMIYDNFHSHPTSWFEVFVMHKLVTTFSVQEHGNADSMTSLNQLEWSITICERWHPSHQAVMIGTTTWAHCSIAVRIEELLLESPMIIILPEHYYSHRISFYRVACLEQIECLDITFTHLACAAHL